MKLTLLVETNPEDFDDKHNDEERHDNLYHRLEMCRYEFDNTLRKRSELENKNVIVNFPKLRDLTTKSFMGANPSRLVSEFKEISIYFGIGSAASKMSAYLDQTADPKEIAAAERISKKQESLRATYAQLLHELPESGKKAAVDFVQRGKQTNKRTLEAEENGEAILCYPNGAPRETQKGYLHNPTTFYDKPHYAGSPEHYDWPAKAQHKYYLLTRWLRKAQLGPFTKLYAGVEDGKTHFIATTADHSVVWQYDGGTDKLYVLGTGMVMPNKVIQLKNATEHGPNTGEMIVTGLLVAKAKMAPVVKPPEQL